MKGNRGLRTWLPAVTLKHHDREGVMLARDGEPNLIPLKRWENDRALHGQLWNGCCDCGLEHLLAFEVFRDHKGQFWLQKRAYRVAK